MCLELSIIQELGPDLGMDLNMSKNEIVNFSDAPDGFPPEFIRFRNNFELLGSPIGDASFCSQFVSNFVKKRPTFKQKLGLLRWRMRGAQALRTVEHRAGI